MNRHYEVPCLGTQGWLLPFLLAWGDPATVISQPQGCEEIHLRYSYAITIPPLNVLEMYPCFA